MLKIAFVCRILIVVCCNICHARQLGRSKVSLPFRIVSNRIRASRKHRHHRRTCIIVALSQHLHQSIGSNAPIASWKTRPTFVHLEFITKTPHDDAWVITVTTNPFRFNFIPHLVERLVCHPIIAPLLPFVEEFIDNQDTILVGQSKE